MTIGVLKKYPLVENKTRFFESCRIFSIIDFFKNYLSFSGFCITDDVCVLLLRINKNEVSRYLHATSPSSL